jgi:hypothetical protein
MSEQKEELNQDLSGFDHVVMMPNIDEDVALPKSASDALPELSLDDEIIMRAKTIKLISDLKGENIEPTAQNVAEAKEIAKQMINNPELRPEFGIIPNETLAFLAGIVAQSQHMLVKDYADFKLYVVNSLVKIAETAKTDKDRLAALTKIGEIDGVDAFKKKTEITHISKTIEEVEDSLLKTLEAIEGKIIDVEEVDEVDEDDDVGVETNDN